MATRKNIVTGLQIFEKDGTGGELNAEYERIWAEGPPPEKMSEEDRLALADAKWHWCEEHDCWLHFT